MGILCRSRRFLCLRRRLFYFIDHDLGSDDVEFNEAYINFQDTTDVIRQARVVCGFSPVAVGASTSGVVIKQRRGNQAKGNPKGVGKGGKMSALDPELRLGDLIEKHCGQKCSRKG